MWEQIESNRRRSAVVVAGMGVLLVATGAALGALFAPDRGGLLFGGLAALIVWFVLWLTTVAKGDAILLRMAGARRIQKQDHPQLWNVVEEMTIASGLGKMPQVYIVDDPAPNAFAAGRDPENAAVAVTTGLLALLDRSELQGVVAHEIGHVKNRDVLLMTTAGIMLGSIVLIAELGQRVLWFGGGFRRSRSGDRGGGGHIALTILAVVVMLLAPILAQLVYFALSRRREYLADASGALFTRYPEGLASALEKLGGSSRPQSNVSRVTAPMYIVRPLSPDEGRRSLSAAFSTHPPLQDRIAILRAMGGNADLRSYEKAWRARHGDAPLIGGRSLGGSASALSAVAPQDSPEHESMARRARIASDAFLAASGYDRTPCRACGATLKIPPSLRARLTRCPRCKTPFGAA